MNFKFIKQWATIGCFSLAVISGLTQHTQAQQSRRGASFFCGTDGGEPATIARLRQNNGNTISKTLIIWKIDDFKGYPPEKRCRLVSKKFQDNQNTGNLKYIVSGKANTWPVLCASKQKYNYIVDCPEPNVLMTLLPEDDSQEMIRKLKKSNRDPAKDMIRKLEELNTGKSNIPLSHFVSNENLQAINVKKWIDNSPETNIEKVNQCMWRCE
ncbi:MAG: COP23 domain-containing protein [Trichodesmium sp. MAG_R03]|nr:COP23 domain-containing protein [Trichodesmium sp. MAG_R03]